MKEFLQKRNKKIKISKLLFLRLKIILKINFFLIEIFFHLNNFFTEKKKMYIPYDKKKSSPHARKMGHIKSQ